MAVPVVAQSASKVKDFVGDNWLKILIGGTVLIGGYAVYKQFFASDDPDVNFDDNEAPPVIDAVTAKTKAEQLFNAMRNLGTDEQTIYDVLSGLSYNDFVMISNAFGKKYYDKSLGVDGGWIFNDKLSLHEWLLEELDNGELNELATYMPDVLERETQAKPMALAGINYM
jgi:hypothetical protein